MNKYLYRKKTGSVKIKTVSETIKEYKRIISFAIVLLVCTMGLLSLFQTNSIATRGYEVEKYEKKLADLNKENHKLLIELADVKSLKNLENDVDKLNAIDSKNIVYITSGSGAVAMDK